MPTQKGGDSVSLIIFMKAVKVARAPQTRPNNMRYQQKTLSAMDSVLGVNVIVHKNQEE